MSCSSDGGIDSEAGGSTEGEFEDPWIGNSPTILPRVLAFGASIQPSHERRQPVFPATLSYEAEHTRGLLERSRRAAFLGSDYDDGDWFVNSEGQVERVLTPSNEFYRRCADIEAEEELLDSDGSEIVLTPSESRASSIRTITSMDDLRFTGLADERAENYVGTDEDEEMVDSEGEGEGEGHFGESDLAAEDEDDLGNDDEPQPPFNPIALGLKEIGGLAHFRVSSYKPGNGVEELISDDTDRYWQSDGIQPHRLTMTFVKCVEIRALRFHVDYHQDESYTPTRIMWYAGTSEHDLLHFATSNLVNPEGWTDVPITGAGGGEDGNSLMAWVVQMQITENHQNGKDTHIRGVKVYGFDDQLRAAGPTGLRDEVAAAAGSSAAGGANHPEFRVDETKTGEENEEAFKAFVRSIESAREFQPGDPSGTASSLDFMEDLQLR